MPIRIEKENQMRHLLNPLDFSVEEIDQLLDLASDIEANPAKYAHVCDGKKIATLFYEPSTRTRLSFEAAMLNLGGRVLGFASADSSSASKGESVADTIRVTPASQISARCATRRKVRRWLLPCTLPSRLSMPATAVTSIRRRPWPIWWRSVL